ncbi:hypothetical protein BDP27DRAFT_1419006 [Rhodocollybia butyracea]|uniref:Uncharacterized protein n=1 Tax=Rhodocollybia butyracea TaxID=206335 RepID=A0A9P5PSE2_9AGAR|nr:hypothetical protein BDP27DRAFT_1419006 [Rhodocollybia butyracea]
MRFTIPFASVLLVASLSFIWATPIAVDRGSEIQQRSDSSESHLNSGATGIHPIEARAPVQGDGPLKKQGDGLNTGQTKDEPEPESKKKKSKKKPRVTGPSGPVSHFELTQATSKDVDKQIQKFVQEGFRENGITTLVRPPKSTSLVPLGNEAKFELKFKSSMDSKYKGYTLLITGTWDPNTGGKMYNGEELFYASKLK